MQGKEHADPRLIPEPGFVVKTWMDDEDCSKVFINVCCVQLAQVLGKDQHAVGGMYRSMEESMDAVRGSDTWCILSKNVFLDTDKRGNRCRVIHCGIDRLTLEAAREDKRFKMVLIASILCKIVEECKIQVPQDLERIKLPRMKSKGGIPSIAAWGIPIHGDENLSTEKVQDLKMESITIHEGNGEELMLAEGKTKRLYGKKQKEQQYSMQYNGVPAHSVNISVSHLEMTKDEGTSIVPKVYTRGSKVFIEDSSEAQPLCIETNLMLNGKACKMSKFDKEKGTLSLEIPIISFGDYIAMCS